MARRLAGRDYGRTVFQFLQVVKSCSRNLGFATLVKLLPSPSISETKRTAEKRTIPLP